MSTTPRSSGSCDAGCPSSTSAPPRNGARPASSKEADLLTFFDAQGRYDARAWLSELAAIAGRDDAFALICDSGGRSGVVSQALDGQLGYRYVFDVPGGIAQWMAEDRPTVDPP